eukprot:TRINITY_DN4742_c0_g1_i1.p2 TRINITY_DN4742_c0_g1~~TRINITY_DN4742_c0_g1_i1.p2  ORF type:complete len:336 (-),score=49.21 TRINITY_DN4742_c0_g1_i1:3295-4302(-)
MQETAPKEIRIEPHPEKVSNGQAQKGGKPGDSAKQMDENSNVQDSSSESSQWLNNIITQVSPSSNRPKFYRFETDDQKTPSNSNPSQDQSDLKPRRSSKAWQKIQYLFCCFHPRTVDYSSAVFDEVVAGEGEGEGSTQPDLLGPMKEEYRDRKTLVLDLDETLVHSSFKPVENPDYVIPVEVEGALTDVYVLRRPHLDHFMEQVCSEFEVVIFTASLRKYADPLLDEMDEHNRIDWRLFRESCVHYQGSYVKDLSRLGRELRNVLIVDNSPNSYIFQPQNAIPIIPFFGDEDDRALLELLPLLFDLSTQFDVRQGLKKWQTQTAQARSLPIMVNA